MINFFGITGLFFIIISCSYNLKSQIATSSLENSMFISKFLLTQSQALFYALQVHSGLTGIPQTIDTSTLRDSNSYSLLNYTLYICAHGIHQTICTKRHPRFFTNRNGAPQFYF
ncbi:MAG: hypothetical protein JWP94_3016 [Mucilaginibacter sp.]|jgi:hypothetical protein|nr:hypothetical protein [Mucilaginibacter sp.]